MVTMAALALNLAQQQRKEEERREEIIQEAIEDEDMKLQKAALKMFKLLLASRDYHILRNDLGYGLGSVMIVVCCMVINDPTENR